jgi:hypothetical protein
VVSIHARGDAVFAVVIAHETTGTAQTYQFSFRVRDRQIIGGRSVLTSASQPGRPAALVRECPPRSWATGARQGEKSENGSCGALAVGVVR